MHNYLTVYIPYLTGSIQDGTDYFGDVQLYNIGLIEFIQLIRDAEYVFTDSFHAIVFSILYSKKFVAYNRQKTNSKIAMNSRISDLLSEVGLSSCLYGDYNRVEEYQFPDNIEEIKERLNVKIQHSYAYLKKYINLIEQLRHEISSVE